jgi:hypothetical protein
VGPRAVLDAVVNKIGREDVDQMHVAQDRDQWRAFINAVMKLRIPKKGWGIS